jgi:hypothetical protein
MNHQTELYAVPGRNTIIDTINPATDRTHYGPIPAGLERGARRCENPRCINPAHRQEN